MPEKSNRRRFLKTLARSSVGIGLFSSTLLSCRDDEMLVRLPGKRYHPPLELSLQIQSQGWHPSLQGHFQDNAWLFRLPALEMPSVDKIRFILDANTVQNNPPIPIAVTPGKTIEIPPDRVVLTYLDEIITDQNTVQTLFFPLPASVKNHYDVAIIGSGIGGGILAAEHANCGSNVALIEAGSYLFPTHVGNLPRRHLPGQFDKNIWSLWHHFRAINYRSGQPSAYVGSQTFNLGGRSLFWGAMAPRLTAMDWQAWPSRLRDDCLSAAGYPRAERLLGVEAEQGAYAKAVQLRLQRPFRHDRWEAIPMAIESTPAQAGAIPRGVFSTADLLLETAFTHQATGRDNLHLYPGHYATKLHTDGRQITGLRCLDLAADKWVELQAEKYVLAAGTLESAKLALNSQLPDPNAQIGRGWGSHPIYYLHFAVPASSPYFAKGETAKLSLTLDQRHGIHSGARIILELGSDFAQSRFVHPQLRREQIAAHPQQMLGEIVVMLSAAANPKNRLSCDRFYEPVDCVYHEHTPSAKDLAITDEYCQRILREIEAQPFDMPQLSLQPAPPGGVSHEGGSLAIGRVVDENLRFFTSDNLYACDMSIFPHSPAANPSLTLATLALRLADYLKK
jgi:choline dehydrogenase-like flavoprotein